MQQSASDPDTRTRGLVLEIVGLATIVGLVATSSYFAFSVSRAGERSFWLLAGGPVVVLTPLALWRAWREGELGEWMRPKAGDFSLGFLAAALLFGATYEFSKVVTPNGSPRAIWLARVYLQLGDPNGLRAHPTELFAGLVAIAAAEEIVWRGLVTSLLTDLAARWGRPRHVEASSSGPRSEPPSAGETGRRRLVGMPSPSRWAWLGSVGLYALAYVPTMWALAAPGGPNPILPLAALGAGLVWGGMARRFGRLAPGIVAHALFDWCVVVMFRLWGESL
jgi:membrane protease YdiL (CAAX protease family)